MQFAKRLERVPPYLFTEIYRKRDELIAKGVDLIDMSVGNPDRPTPDHIIKVMHEAIDDPSTHDYPRYKGTADYCQAVAVWMEHRFGVKNIDPNTEIVSAIGSKEAIYNTAFAFVEAGDYTLIPEPGYPVYGNSTIFAGGEPYMMPLLLENNFLPNLDAIPESVAHKAKLMWINYPNNPTTAVATLEDFEKMVAFCKKYDILLCHDHSYSEIGYDGYKSPSVLQIPGAKDVAIEYYSFSKSYNMAGWRIGFVVGSAAGIKGLEKVKTHVDSGIFKAIQRAAIAAFETPAEELQKILSVYQRRLDIFVNGLKSFGLSIEPPKATLYVWVPVAKGYTSTEFVTLLMEKCAIICSPGNSYGASGEGFFRISLTTSSERIHLAIQRMKEAGIRY